MKDEFTAISTGRNLLVKLGIRKSLQWVEESCPWLLAWSEDQRKLNQAIVAVRKKVCFQKFREVQTMPHLLFIRGPQGQMLLVKFLIPAGRMAQHSLLSSQTRDANHVPRAVPGAPTPELLW